MGSLFSSWEYCGYRFIGHEQGQNARIDSLQSQVSILSEQLKDDSPASVFTADVTDDGFDYLAIGNSITIHPITEFWWGEWRMAASDRNHDYYHLVVRDLQDRNGDINTVALLFCFLAAECFLRFAQIVW